MGATTQGVQGWWWPQAHTKKDLSFNYILFKDVFFLITQNLGIFGGDILKIFQNLEFIEN